MPELQHHFRLGKMNKDLDERLVPNGEYRDAQNIEIVTSEGSDVGSVQNVIGNQLKDGKTYNVPCIFQIWIKKDEERFIEPEILEDGFHFVKKPILKSRIF